MNPPSPLFVEYSRLTTALGEEYDANGESIRYFELLKQRGQVREAMRLEASKSP